MMREIDFTCLENKILANIICTIDQYFKDQQLWLILNQFEVFGESKYLRYKGESARIKSLSELFTKTIPLFIKVQIYQAEDMYDINIHTKQAFEDSHCLAIFLLYDCNHAELHCKDNKIAQSLGEVLHNQKIEMRIVEQSSREKMDVK